MSLINTTALLIRTVALEGEICLVNVITKNTSSLILDSFIIIF